MKPVTKFLTILFITLLSSPSWSETLILKCDSRRFGDDEWIGNVVFWEINFETKRVLMKEINDTTVEGWIVHKLTSESDDYLTIRKCIPSNSSNCNMSEDLGYLKSYNQIDRTTGILKDITKVNGSNVVGWEYQCNKTDKLF